jgi:hypothetical protein
LPVGVASFRFDNGVRLLFCFFSRFCHCTVVEENRWTAIPWRRDWNVMHEGLNKSKWCPSEKNWITRISQYLLFQFVCGSVYELWQTRTLNSFGTVCECRRPGKRQLKAVCCLAR